MSEDLLSYSPMLVVLVLSVNVYIIKSSCNNYKRKYLLGTGTNGSAPFVCLMMFFFFKLPALLRLPFPVRAKVDLTNKINKE